jgi:hypothetical protein
LTLCASAASAAYCRALPPKVARRALCSRVTALGCYASSVSSVQARF